QFTAREGGRHRLVGTGRYLKLARAGRKVAPGIVPRFEMKRFATVKQLIDAATELVCEKRLTGSKLQLRGLPLLHNSRIDMQIKLPTGELLTVQFCFIVFYQLTFSIRQGITTCFDPACNCFAYPTWRQRKADGQC